MLKRFHVTYEIVTPESADQQADAHGTEHALPPEMFGPEAGAFKTRFECLLGLA